MITEYEDFENLIDGDTIYLESITEGSSLGSDIVKSELRMIPLLLAGGIVTGGVLLGKKIMSISRRKKLVVDYEKIHKLKIKQAKEESSEKQALLDEKIKILDDKLKEKYENDAKLIGTLSAETDIEVIDIKLKLATDKEKKDKLEETKKTKMEKLKTDKEKATKEFDKVKNDSSKLPKNKQIENIKAGNDDLKKKLESGEISQITYDLKIKTNDERIQKLKDSKGDDKEES